ncbi:DNA replication licensing factor MCM4 [Artemisia annua]|uniref:DNA replication licensing factor MCM4 n=1 Tax=Artemisia annua TaxID=35608 RepID=A0A2U1QE06_ARTAN|nr:DNA replication licensing factor MCM4 [Artemisia annua]
MSENTCIAGGRGAGRPKAQETPDEILERGTPHIVSLLMHGKLVDTAKPGA